MGGERENLSFPLFPPNFFPSPGAGVVFKEEVHTEVRPKGWVLFPDVLGLGEGQKKCGHVEGRARTGLCL